MATTVGQTTPNASTKTMVYWIVGIIAVILVLAYTLRATGPITDPTVIIAPSPVKSFPVPQ